MELLGSVQPMVLTLDQYQQVYGEDDPEELNLLQLEDKELARRIASGLNDLYFMETAFDQPSEEEGLSEEIGTAEDFRLLRALAAESMGKNVDDYQEGRVPPGFLYNHLINHEEDSGYYLPVDFMQAFVLEDISLGSSIVLLKELEALEPLLAGLHGDLVAQALQTPDDQPSPPIPGPVGVWHALCRLCRSSVETGLPIHLG